MWDFICGQCLSAQVRRFRKDGYHLSGRVRGGLEDMTAKAWIFVVIVILVLSTLGPLAVNFAISKLGGSTNTVSSELSIPIAGGSFVS